MSKKHIALAAIISFYLFSPNVQAQSPWLNNNKPGFVSLEFMKPELVGGNDGISFLTAVYDISGGFSISEKSELIFDLPVAHAKIDNTFEEESETSVGNIYLAFRTGDRSKAVRGEFGVVLPTTGSNKEWTPYIGAFSMPNATEKFSEDTWSLSAKMIAEKVINDESGLYYRVRGGLTYIRDIEYDIYGIFLDATGQFGVRTEKGANLFLGINSRTNIYDNVEYGEESDRTSFFLAFGASYRIKNFEPGLTFNLPLDDPYKQIVNHVIGVSFLFHLDQ